jgi:transcriptional regulator with XRE-family HTH domain
VDSPTVLRRRLGSELRKMREGRKLTGAHLAKELSWSESKISRIESGKSPMSDGDAKLLLAQYGVYDAQEVRQFISLVRRSRQPGWWHSYGDALPDWFKAYVGFESDASEINLYETELVPGILQTEEYARAVIARLKFEASAEEVERRAALRIQRQETLSGAGSPRVWAVLNEAILRRPVGSAQVMHKQLHHLADVADANPNVTVQILPFAAGAHCSMGYSFSVLSFEDIPGSIVYTEGLTSATYMDKLSDVSRHAEIFKRLMASSTRPDSSVDWLRTTAEEYKA